MISHSLPNNQFILIPLQIIFIHLNSYGFIIVFLFYSGYYVTSEVQIEWF